MKTIVIDKHFYNSYPKEFISFANEIFVRLSDLHTEYPNFNIWLIKVFQDLPLGKRSVIVKLYNDEIIGISIVKHTTQEQKICTFRILDKYQRLGLGRELMEDSLYYLGNDFPLITVSEKRIIEFSGFLYKLKFEEVERVHSLYLPDTSEVVFNGLFKTDVKRICFF